MATTFKPYAKLTAETRRQVYVSDHAKEIVSQIAYNERRKEWTVADDAILLYDAVKKGDITITHRDSQPA